MKKPSLFDYATSELSQDAILCWLLEWAKHDEYKEYQKLAKELIALMYNLQEKNKISRDDVKNLIKIERQYYNIDVYFQAKIIDKTVSFIIEDKTFTSHHSNQLERYKDIVEQDEIKEDEIVPIYFKTGYIYEWDEDVVKHGYHVLNLKQWNIFLSKYAGIENDILEDYTSYIKGMLTSRDEEINKLRLGDTECFKYDYVQYEFLKQVKEKCGECIGAINTKGEPYNLYNGTSFGRPWTQYQFVKFENVYNQSSEYVFYRVDSRKDRPYLSIRQYTDEKVKDSTELKDKKLKRLKEYKFLFKAVCAESLFEFEDPLNDWSGNKESEIAVLFFNKDTNSAKELWSKWPELHNSFVDRIENHAF